MSINFSKYPNQIAGLRKSGSHYVSGGEERLVKLWDYVTWWLKATEAGKKKHQWFLWTSPRKDWQKQAANGSPKISQQWISQASNIGMGEDL